MTGIRVSPKGEDVLADNPEKLLIDERFPLLKVFVEGEDSIVLPAGDTSATKKITHNLGYISAVLVYGEIKAGSGKRYFITGRNPFLSVAGGDEVFMFSEIDKNTLTIKITAGGAFGTNKVYGIHYYITYDSLEIT